MRKLILGLRRRWANIRILRSEYFHIQYRYWLGRMNRWASLTAAWRYSIAGLLVILLFMAVLVGYQYRWTGFGEQLSASGDFQHSKTLWDWMSLLLVPALLAFLAFKLTTAQKEREIAVAVLNKREQALQQYFDYMTSLLAALESRDPDKVKNEAQIARARTHVVLEMLDGKRKGHVIRFLTETELLHRGAPMFSMRRADLRDLELEPGSYDEIDLSGSNIDNAVMPMCSMHRANMMGISLRNADLESTEFSSADLNYALLTKSDFYRARLLGTQLIKADLRDANLEYANLTDAVLRTAELEGANLRRANLTGAYLKFADLGFANLKDANLTKADITEANLYGANLKNADLTEADLTGSNVSRGQLKKAKSTDGALLPAGFS